MKSGKRLKVLEETDAVWRVQDSATGREFSIAKKGVSPSFSKVVQHFAMGGSVMAAPVLDAGEAAILAAAQPAPAPADLSDAIAKARYDKLDVTPQPAVMDALKQVAAGVARAGPPSMRLPEPGTPEFQGQAAPATPAPEAAAPMPPETALYPPPGGGAAPLAPMPAMPSAKGGDFGMGKAYQDAVAAEVAKADVAQAKAAEQEVLAAQRLEQQQAIAQQWDAKYQENEARIAKQQQEVATGKVDPSRWWNDQSVGGGLGRKVMASIALALGALGGNQQTVMGAIMKNIEADIDAQKTDLGKKQNLLNSYVQQGHDIQNAKRLAMADAQSMYAAQLEKVAAKHAGKEAKAAAMGTVAELKAKAAAQRQAVYQQGFQNQLQLLDRMQNAQALQLKAQAAAAEAGGLVAPGWARGAVKISDKEAETFRTGITASQAMATDAKRLRELVEKHGTKLLPGEVKSEMEALTSRLTMQYKTVQNLGALSGQDIGLTRGEVPDPTGWTPEWIANNAKKLQLLEDAAKKAPGLAAAALGLQQVAGGVRSREELVRQAAMSRGAK